MTMMKRLPKIQFLLLQGRRIRFYPITEEMTLNTTAEEYTYGGKRCRQWTGTHLVYQNGIHYSAALFCFDWDPVLLSATRT